MYLSDIKTHNYGPRLSEDNSDRVRRDDSIGLITTLHKRFKLRLINATLSIFSPVVKSFAAL